MVHVFDFFQTKQLYNLGMRFEIKEVITKYTQTWYLILPIIIRKRKRRRIKMLYLFLNDK